MIIDLRGGPFDGAVREVDHLPPLYKVVLTDVEEKTHIVRYKKGFGHVYVFMQPLLVGSKAMVEYIHMLEAACSVLNQNVKDLKKKIDCGG